jgi:hypothetical protein
MIISSQLLHQIADPALPPDERARLRCRLARQLEDVGNYDAAREAMGELWPRAGTGTVARIAYELIIRSSAQPSLIRIHTRDTE